jgi:hypothetical protein
MPAKTSFIRCLPSCFAANGLRALATGLFALACSLPLVGCGGAAVPSRPPAPRTTADALSPAEIELFLALIHAHPQRKAPEFTNSPDERPIDEALAPRNMVAAFRTRFQMLFDAEAQGQELARNGDWARLLREYKLAPAEFAALVTRVSCAVTRLQLEPKYRFADLATKAQTRVAALVAEIERLDRIPPAQMTSETARARTQAIVQLGQTVALLEFSEKLQALPEASLSAVAARLADLKSLLPADHSETSFQDLDRVEGRLSSRAETSPEATSISR